MMKNICPVCFYDGLYELPYDSDGDGSYEICPCCGFQFGYDDFPYSDKEEKIKAWRQSWTSKGYPWFSKSRKCPVGWIPPEPLRAFLDPDTESDAGTK